MYVRQDCPLQDLSNLSNGSVPNTVDTKLPARRLDKELVRTIQSHNCDEHRREWLKADAEQQGDQKCAPGDPHAMAYPSGTISWELTTIGS